MPDLKPYIKQRLPYIANLLRNRIQPLFYKCKKIIANLLPSARLFDFVIKAAVRNTPLLPPANASPASYEVKLISESGAIDRATPINTVQPELRSLSGNFVHVRTEPLFALHATQVLAVIDAPRRLGGSVHAIISRDGDLLAEVSYDYYGAGNHRFLSRIYYGRAIQVSGNACVIMEPNSETYGHWMLEMVPRILLAREYIGSDKIDAWTFIISGSRHDYQVESIRKIGLNLDRVIWADSKACYQVENALVPSYCSRGAQNIRADCIHRLRKLYGVDDADVSQASRKIYVARGKEPFRCVLNESEVIDFMKGRGFEIIYPRNHSIEEKAALFSRASLVVGVVSSGGANCVFMPRGSKVIEIFPTDYISHTGWAISELLGFEYYCCSGNGELDFVSHNRCQNIIIGLDTLRQTLELTEAQ